MVRVYVLALSVVDCGYEPDGSNQRLWNWYFFTSPLSKHNKRIRAKIFLARNPLNE
jgi:hypothetical protein